MKKFILAIVTVFLVACQMSDQKEKTPTLSGEWVGTFELNDSTNLPFNMVLVQVEEQLALTITNAGEEIRVENIQIQGDSLKFEMPVFESVFDLQLIDGQLEGSWTKYNNSKYAVPFKAYPQKERYLVERKAEVSMTGKWAVTFSPNAADDAYPAIGIFEQNENKVTGTIITETGDYRYLDGVVEGRQFKMSTFDGAHAFVFEGEIDTNDEIRATFYSGRTWAEPFMGVRDENVVLRFPDQLTFLNEGYEQLDFAFPDVDGDTVRMADFKGKATIVQILGSWCPNCMDETKYYVELSKKFPELQIVGLAYERSEDFAKSAPQVKKMKADLEVEYPVLIAGTWSKKKAAESLPMLNHVMSFPTSIFINKAGEIMRIHTGFYGPGTGEYYEAYIGETESLIRRMLAD